MIPCGFSSAVAPCAHAICCSSGDSVVAGAYPAALMFAPGTPESSGSDDELACPIATNTVPAATTAAPAVTRFIVLTIDSLRLLDRKQRTAESDGCVGVVNGRWRSRDERGS